MLRSTFLAAEEAIEQKKAQALNLGGSQHWKCSSSFPVLWLKMQVRLAEAEAQRDRQQLELQLGTSEISM